MTHWSLSALRQRYVVDERPLPRVARVHLLRDPRVGVQTILATVERRVRAARAEQTRLRAISRHERRLWASGLARVAGVDEAGVSPLAGPIVAAAVILPPGTRILEVDDSKKLSPACRERLAPIIRQRATAWSVAFVEPAEIDELNVYWAALLAMRRAVDGLLPQPEYVLIDARRLDGLAWPQESLVHGDSLSLTIAAASILAKTARDARMRELDQVYPGYGFAQHKGYPVAAHRRALGVLGPSPIHRRSFELVRLSSPGGAAARTGGQQGQGHGPR